MTTRNGNWAVVIVGLLVASLPALANDESAPDGPMPSSQGEVFAAAKVELTLRVHAPDWWSIKLPEAIKQNDKNVTLKQGEEVKILDKKQFSTILGRDTWFLVEKVEKQAGNDNEQAGTPKTGWVFGGDSGKLLTPALQGSQNR